MSADLVQAIAAALQQAVTGIIANAAAPAPAAPAASATSAAPASTAPVGTTITTPSTQQRQPTAALEQVTLASAPSAEVVASAPIQHAEIIRPPPVDYATPLLLQHMETVQQSSSQQGTSKFSLEIATHQEQRLMLQELGMDEVNEVMTVEQLESMVDSLDSEQSSAERPPKQGRGSGKRINTATSNSAPKKARVEAAPEPKTTKKASTAPVSALKKAIPMTGKWAEKFPTESLQAIVEKKNCWGEWMFYIIPNDGPARWVKFYQLDEDMVRSLLKKKVVKGNPLWQYYKDPPYVPPASELRRQQSQKSTTTAAVTTPETQGVRAPKFSFSSHLANFDLPTLRNMRRMFQSMLVRICQEIEAAKREQQQEDGAKLQKQQQQSKTKPVQPLLQQPKAKSVQHQQLQQDAPQPSFFKANPELKMRIPKIPPADASRPSSSGHGGKKISMANRPEESEEEDEDEEDEEIVSDGYSSDSTAVIE